MRSKLMPGGGQCSELGFGCGAVMGRVSRKDSLAAMHTALGAGVTLFDTARSYGYGESESVVGEFLVGRRDQVLVSTKFGIQPSRRRRWKSLLRPAVRVVLQLLPQARQAVRRQAAGQVAAAPLTVEELHRSLEESLRQLRTEYVDFFFLHDVPLETVARDDLFAALEQLRQQGKVRWFGVSSNLEAAAAAVVRRANAAAVQMPVNLSNLRRAGEVAAQALQSRDRVLLANHTFGGVDGAPVSQQRLSALAQDDRLPMELREKLRSSGENVLSDVMLPMVLRHVGAHSAVVSMMRAKNIAANIASLERDTFTAGELALLFEKLA